jgi:hypothetical protein
MSAPTSKAAGFWRRLTGSGATYSTPPPSRQTTGPLPAASDSDSDESATPVLWLLESALWSAHGAQADEVLAAVKDSSAWPQPDPQLIDDTGFPVWSNRIAELDLDSLREPLKTAQTAETAHAASLPEDHLRALALACGPLDPLLARAAELLATVTDEAPRQAIQLRITVCLPKHWAAPERALAVRYIDQFANAFEIKSKSRWLVNAIGAPGEQDQIPALLDQLALTLRRERQPALWIVLATDSALSPSRIAALQADGRLYKSGHHDNMAASEGAAGVLIAGAKAPPSWTGAAMRLHWAQGRRDSSADASKRPDSATLETLGAAVLSAAQRESADLCAIVSDADQRKSRTLEINLWAMQTFPNVVAEENCLSIGRSSGHLEVAVAQLQALALAHHLAREQQRPALAVSVGDDFTRTAILTTPANALPPAAG